jgi:hypothetical protein
MEQQGRFPDALGSRSIDEGFGPLIEWLDAHPDRDVTEYPGWREAVSHPEVPATDSTPP